MHQSVINEGSAVQVESGKPPARHSHCTGLFKGICLVCIRFTEAATGAWEHWWLVLQSLSFTWLFALVLLKPAS